MGTRARRWPGGDARDRSIRRASPRRSRPSGRRRCSACRPTCSGCSRTGTRSGAPDLSVLPAGRARRRAVPGRGEATADRDVPGRQRPGSSTARPRASSPPAAARSGWRGPGTVGRARPGRTLSVDADGTIWCAVPEHARFSYFGDPEKTAAAWRGDSLHRRRPRPARRRRLPLPRRTSRGPDHQRRRQRLPARGRAGPRRAPRRHRHRRVRRRRPRLGPAGVRGGRRRRSTRASWRRTHASTWRRRSGPRPGSSTTRCRAR